MSTLFHLHSSRPSSPKPAQRAPVEQGYKPVAAPAKKYQKLLQKYLLEMLPANEVAML